MRRGASDAVLIAGIVVAGLLVAAVGAPIAYNLTRANPAIAPVGPSPAVNTLTQFAGKPGAADVGKAHRDFAAVLKRKPLASVGTLKAKLAEFHALLYADTPAANTLPGFGAAFDQAFTAALGSDDGPLDPAKADAFLTAVATALGG